MRLFSSPCSPLPSNLKVALSEVTGVQLSGNAGVGDWWGGQGPRASLSRELVTLWADDYEPAMALLRRIFPRGLLHFLRDRRPVPSASGAPASAPPRPAEVQLLPPRAFLIRAMVAVHARAIFCRAALHLPMLCRPMHAECCLWPCTPLVCKEMFKGIGKLGWQMQGVEEREPPLRTSVLPLASPVCTMYVMFSA